MGNARLMPRGFTALKKIYLPKYLMRIDKCCFDKSLGKMILKGKPYGFAKIFNAIALSVIGFIVKVDAFKWCNSILIISLDPQKK